MSSANQKKNDRLTLSLVVTAWVAAIGAVSLGSGFSLTDAAAHLRAGDASAHVDGKHTLPTP